MQYFAGPIDLYNQIGFGGRAVCMQAWVSDLVFPSRSRSRQNTRLAPLQAFLASPDSSSGTHLSSVSAFLGSDSSEASELLSDIVSRSC